MMSIREALHKSHDLSATGAFKPQSALDSIAPGSFYLTERDDMGRRFYSRAS